MMNVLLVTHNYLHIQGGGAYATRAIINAFAEVANSVTLLYPAIKDCLCPSINSKVKAIPIYYDSPRIMKAINVYLGRIHRYYNVFDKFLNEEIDTVVFDTSIASHKLINTAKERGIRVITIHHNFQVEFAKDDTSISIKYPLLYWIKKAEKAAVINSDINICLTKCDEDALREHYSEKAQFAVLGIFEPERRAPISPITRSSRHNYIITGNLSVKQTTDALYPWIKTYYPLLKDVDPQARLIIAGYKPQKELYDLCSLYDIVIVDSPPSMSPYLMESNYYICPTHLGSGIKLRIMDGLRVGMPVITHKNSARGYESFLQIAIFVYDNRSSFERAVSQLLEKKVDSKMIQEYYEREFSFDEGVKRLKRIVSKLKER